MSLLYTDNQLFSANAISYSSTLGGLVNYYTPWDWSAVAPVSDASQVCFDIGQRFHHSSVSTQSQTYSFIFIYLTPTLPVLIFLDFCR